MEAISETEVDFTPKFYSIDVIEGYTTTRLNDQIDLMRRSILDMNYNDTKIMDWSDYDFSIKDNTRTTIVNKSQNTVLDLKPTDNSLYYATYYGKHRKIITSSDKINVDQCIIFSKVCNFHRLDKIFIYNRKFGNTTRNYTQDEIENKIKYKVDLNYSSSCIQCAEYDTTKPDDISIDGSQYMMELEMLNTNLDEDMLTIRGYLKKKILPLNGVYFIKPQYMNIIKIGCSTNLNKRYHALLTASPLPLNIIGFEECDMQYDLEGLLHERFKSYRLHGEWFKYKGEIIDYINGLEKIPIYKNGDSW